MPRSAGQTHHAGSRGPSGRGTALPGPVPAAAWLLGGLGAGPWREFVGVLANAPHRRISSSSRNAELSIMAVGMGGMTAKLLVVDDEPRTAELTAEVLRRAGYSVEVAGSGTEAVARARSSAPDLMLLDYEMPDMQAPEVLDELRSGGDRVGFPVILFPGPRPSPGAPVIGIERGATDYIGKGTDRHGRLARVRGCPRRGAPSDLLGRGPVRSP